MSVKKCSWCEPLERENKDLLAMQEEDRKALREAQLAVQAAQEAHARSLAEWNAKRREMHSELRRLRTALAECEQRAEITLADHYAAHAMLGLLGACEANYDPHHIAHDAYEQAQAMMDLRAQIRERRQAELVDEERKVLRDIGDYFARVTRPDEER